MNGLRERNGESRATAIMVMNQDSTWVVLLAHHGPGHNKLAGEADLDFFEVAPLRPHDGVV